MVNERKETLGIVCFFSVVVFYVGVSLVIERQLIDLIYLIVVAYCFLGVLYYKTRKWLYVNV